MSFNHGLKISQLLLLGRSSKSRVTFLMMASERVRPLIRRTSRKNVTNFDTEKSKLVNEMDLQIVHLLTHHTLSLYLTHAHAVRDTVTLAITHNYTQNPTHNHTYNNTYSRPQSLSIISHTHTNTCM